MPNYTSTTPNRRGHATTRFLRRLAALAVTLELISVAFLTVFGTGILTQLMNRGATAETSGEKQRHIVQHPCSADAGEPICSNAEPSATSSQRCATFRSQAYCIEAAD